MFKLTRVLQFNIESREGFCVDTISGRDIVRLAKEINANTIALFARDAWGRAFYNSKVSEKIGKLGARDLVREVIEEAKKEGLSVVLMIGHTSNLMLYKKHPEWVQRDRNGRVISMDSDPDEAPRSKPEWPLMCLNSPFVEHVKREIEEVISYGADGVFLDSFRYMPDKDKACYCNWCARKYEIDNKARLEPRGDVDEFEWRIRVNVERIAELHRHVKSLSKRCLLVYNNHPLGWRGRACTIAERARDYIDVVFAECSETDYQPPGFIAEMTKLSRALTGKPVWASRNSFHTALTSSQTTDVAIRQGLREAFAGGGWPLYLVFSSTYKAGHDATPARQVMSEVEVLEEYMLDSKPVEYIGVVYSNRSKDLARYPFSTHITDSFRGFYYALLEEGLPVNYISDSSLESGAFTRYRAIVLANTLSMSSRADANILDYARRGGGVIATYKTGFLDERGSKKSSPIVSKLLGLEVLDVVKSEWAYLKTHSGHPVLRHVENKLLLWGDFDRVFLTRRTPPELAWHLRVRADSSNIMAALYPSDRSYGEEYENGRSPPPPRLVDGSPGLVVKGRVVYFPGQAGRIYWRTGNPGIRRLIVNSVVWAAGEPPVRVLSRGFVELEAYTRDRQLLIHLLNHAYDRRIIVRSNRALDNMLSSTPESIWPPLSVVTLTNVRLLVSRAYGGIKRVYSPLSKDNNSIKILEGSSPSSHHEIVVKELHEYCFLVVELD